MGAGLWAVSTGSNYNSVFSGTKFSVRQVAWDVPMHLRDCEHKMQPNIQKGVGRMVSIPGLLNQPDLRNMFAITLSSREHSMQRQEVAA